MLLVKRIKQEKIYCLFLVSLISSSLISCGKSETPKDSQTPNLAASVHADWVNNPEASNRVDSTEEDLDLRLGPVLELAKKLAITILTDAAASTQPPESTIYKTLITALENANFDVPEPGKDLLQCQRETNVLAFVMTNSPHTIHLCKRAMQKGSRKRLAQILIHETSHVAGVYDECMATRIEVSAMRESRVGLAFHNGYMEACGIKS